LNIIHELAWAYLNNFVIEFDVFGALIDLIHRILLFFFTLLKHFSQNLMFLFEFI